FSRTIRPGDRALKTEKTLHGLEPDDLHACASLNSDRLLSVQVLNTTKQPQVFDLKIGEQIAVIEITANALQTIQVKLS
ncbi:MAG: glycosyl hydrolase, partial [Gammaproteobacteria bacterium]|nr:glycosyl hydrolase [Gammaproteobacteria bacterium]